MQKLKFRVWDKLAETMIYPDKGYQGHYYIDLNGRFCNMQNGSGAGEYIVMLYTGKFDQNGLDIYEYDVIEFETTIWKPAGPGSLDDEPEPQLVTITGLVVFEDGKFCVRPYAKFIHLMHHPVELYSVKKITLLRCEIDLMYELAQGNQIWI